MAELKSPASQEASKDYFNSLPNELLEQVASHLQLLDKLKFRLLMRKADHEFITSILKDHLSRVYVCPTKRSLRNFGGICRSKFYNEHIKEVVFVPKTYHDTSVIPDIKRFAKLCQNYFNTTGHRNPQEAQEVAGGVLSLPQASFVERSFAIHLEIAREYAYSNANFDREESRDDVASQLEEGLLQLPRLDAVAVDSELSQRSRAGLNKTSIWSIPPAENTDVHQLSRDYATQYAMMSFEPQVTGTGAFYLALSNFKLAISSLRIPWSSKPDEIYTSPPLSLLHGTILAGLPATLTTLRLGRLCVWPAETERRQFQTAWGMFSQKATILKELVVEIDPDDLGRNPCTYYRLVDIVLRWSAFPHLETFKIFANPHDHCSARFHGIIQSDDLSGFLTRHCRTIRRLELHELIAVGLNRRTTPGKMRILLAEMQRDMLIEECIWTVYSHGPNDCSYSGDGDKCVSPHPRYWLRPKKTFHRSVFEELAAELEIEEKDHKWDFGKFVEGEDMPGELERDLDVAVEKDQARLRAMFAKREADQAAENVVGEAELTHEVTADDSKRSGV